LFFVISLAFWSTEARAIAKTGTYVCGAFGAAALVATLAGTVFHLVAAAAVIAIAMGIPKAGE
jgi:hypothetical protein